MKDGEKVAHLIKELREERGLSREELAQTTLMSIESIICIEENIIQLAVATLYKIARALRVPAGTFIDEEPMSRIESTHTIYRLSAQDITCENLDYPLLASTIGEKKMQPCMIELTPSQDVSRGFVAYKGGVLIYVLLGSVVATYGTEYHELVEGDSLYIDASTPHAIHANGGKSAKVLITLSPTI